MTNCPAHQCGAFSIIQNTGLIHFGYREYDSAIGRFISPDPLGYAGGDVDLYGYCLDDPINFVDRVGLFGGFGASRGGTSGGLFDAGTGASHNNSLSQDARDRANAMEGQRNRGYNNWVKENSWYTSSPDTGNSTSPSKSSAEYARELKEREVEMAAKAAKEEKARLDRAAQLAAQQANRDRKAREKKERNDRQRHLDILENKHQKTGILDSVPTIGGGVVAPNGVQGAPVKDVAVAEKEAPAKAKAPGAFRNDKKAGVDNYSPAPVKTKLAGADYSLSQRGKNKSKKSSKLGLSELGIAALKGAVSGTPIGMAYGSPLGPGGMAAGGATGAFVGAAVNSLYEVGSIAIENIFGIDKDLQQRYRDAMEKFNVKTRKR